MQTVKRIGKYCHKIESTSNLAFIPSFSKLNRDEELFLIDNELKMGVKNHACLTCPVNIHAVHDLKVM